MSIKQQIINRNGKWELSNKLTFKIEYITFLMIWSILTHFWDMSKDDAIIIMNYSDLNNESF